MPDYAPDLTKIAQSLRANLSPETLGPYRSAIAVRIMRQLALGKPVPLASAARLANRDPAEIAEQLQSFTAMGFAELDDAQSVVGMVLSIAPTRHGFHVGGRQLYVWCALDALFMPAVLGHTARVTSTCPVSGEAIELSVTPHRVERRSASDIHVSVAAPIVGERCGGPIAGRSGSFCGKVVFLASGADAETWRRQSPTGIALPLDAAFELAREVWADPFTAAASSSQMRAEIVS